MQIQELLQQKADAGSLPGGYNIKVPKDNLLVMNLCGRGDKDVFAVAERLGMKV